MKWPTHTDYQDAIQAPQICFAEPELKAGEIVCDVLGLPRVMSGNFASVYELKTATGRSAIRCFVRQVPGQQGRYARLSEHLSKLTLPYLVKFEFIMRGILVHGDYYPVVKMQWVEGVPLNVYVDEHYKESETMAGLATKWRDLVNALRRHQIAHGDFQHGNVMVTRDGEFRLVDYDGMFVPAFGRGRSPELGHANFQHPRRTPDYYEERLDNFSALVIYLSFLALAKEPELWEKFYAGDNLVLGSADYRNPRNSAALQRLKQSPDEKVRQLAAVIEQCCLLPIAQVPWFEETVIQLEQGTLKQFLESLPPPAPATTETWWDEGGAPAPETGASRPAEPSLSRPATPTMSRPATPPAPSLSRPAAPAMSRPAEPSMSRPSPTPSAAPGQGTRPAAPMISRAGASLAGTRPSPPPGPAAPVVPEASTATVNIPRDGDPGMPFFVGAVVLSVAAFVPVLRPWCGLAGAVAGVLALVKARPGAGLTKVGGLAAGLLGLALGIAGLISLFAERPKGPAPGAGPAGQDQTVLPAAPPPASAAQPVARPVAAPVQTPPAAPVEAAFKATLLGSLPGHTKEVGTLSFSADGRWLASGGADNSLKIWDVQAGRLKKSLDGLGDAAHAVKFLADGRTVAVVCLDNTVAYWDSEAAALRNRVTAFTNNLWTIVLGPDGRTLATGGADRKVVRLVEASSGEVRRQLPAHSSWVRSADFSPDGKWLAVTCFDDSLHLWDLAAMTAKWSIPWKGNATEAVAFSGDGGRLAVGAESRLARVLNGANGQVLHTLTGHSGEVKACALSRDGRLVATGGTDKSVRIWNAADGVLLQTLAGHADTVAALSFSLDGHILASAGADQMVKLWSLSP